ncbi:MAG TPA: hypothetical protein VFO93_09690 [Hymenobacter sp.]|uniref:hypothetical protein n=1 Tax=Hymenobacter sp. TaxID=1898978 RepID=UPI002D7E94B9|nr:hypothetical protein [Hymenobacter sp.]HET9503803.1 hypothetical protein [Hymenobacter sp.]
MQPIPETSPRFSNLQLELLRLYADNISEQDLLKVKNLLADFFAERAIAGADAWWDANNFTDADVERMLHTKMRAGRPE